MNVLNRLFNLVMLQIGDKFSFKDNKKEVFPLIVKLVGFAAIFGIAYLIFVLMNKYIHLKPTNAMMLFIIFVSQICLLVVNAFSMTDSLYGSKDNPILFSLPAKHIEVFISKIIVYYILELFSNVTFLLPILIAYGAFAKTGVAYFFVAILISFVLPLVCVLIGSLLSILISVIKKLLKRVSIIYVFIFIGLLIALFISANGMIEKLPQPIHFVAMYNYIIKLIMTFIDNVNKYAIFYKWFSNMLFSVSFGKYFGLTLALVVGLVIANILCSWPLFFKLASNSSENAVIKKHKGENKESKHLFWAFYKKELKISFRTFGEVAANYVMVVFLPLFIFIVDGLFNHFDLSNFGNNLIFGFNIMIGLIVLTASNTQSAKALSEEGSEFILLKTSPVDTKLIAWAKILNNAIISTFFIMITCIIMGALKVMNAEKIAAMFFVFLLIDYGHIMWSFQLDLRNPQIKDVSLFGKVSNKENIVRSITIGLIFSVVFGLLAILLPLVGLMPLLYIMAVMFALWRLVIFAASLRSYFYDIEL